MILIDEINNNDLIKVMHFKFVVFEVTSFFCVHIYTPNFVPHIIQFRSVCNHIWTRTRKRYVAS